MNRCEKCKIDIFDDAVVCPLCQNVLELSENPGNSNISGKSVMYPIVENKMRKRRLVVKLVIFTLLVSEFILVLINIKTFNDFWWSKVTGACFAFVCFCVALILDSTVGHRKKMEMITLSTIVFLLILDKLSGGTGWSLIYGNPCTILAMEVVILILIIFNRKSWQEYILLQFLMLLISILNLFFSIVWNTSDYLLGIISMGVALIFILGMFFFGKREAVNEVSRRFKA